MSIPASPRQTEWQSARIPKLSYRKPLSQDEVERLNLPVRNEVTAQQQPINRADSSHSFATKSSVPSPTFSPASRSKGSFLSGLFSKEPTLKALAQVEADLKAKHGSATPQSVPHVSSRKMPEHVPKVNSKWDGVPEAVKTRDREQKQQRRLSQRSGGGQLPQSAQSNSLDKTIPVLTDGQPHRSRRLSDTGSQVDSWQSQNEKSYTLRASSTYTSSSEESNHAGLASPAPSQSLRSPSGSSLPEITSFFPHHNEQAPPSAPKRWQSVHSTTTQSTKSSNKSFTANGVTRDRQSNGVDAIPEDSPMSNSTSQGTEVAAIPRHLAKQKQSVTANGTLSDAPNPTPKPKPVKRAEPTPVDAFLAGEARPVDFDAKDREDRYTDLPLRHRFHQSVADNSARAPTAAVGRSVPRGSTKARIDAAPWEAESPRDVACRPTEPTVSRSRVPKALAMFR